MDLIDIARLEEHRRAVCARAIAAEAMEFAGRVGDGGVAKRAVGRFSENGLRR